MIAAFPWRKLTTASTLAHRVREDGALVLRNVAAPELPPLTTARVRDDRGGFVVRPLDALGFTWTRDGDGWILRTSGEAKTMAAVTRTWGALAAAECARLGGLDPHVVLMTIACEVGAVTPDKDGNVKAPSTEKGYPRRTGEKDPGDFARDLEDWQAFQADKKRGTRASHGLMQTLISTAIGVRPDLFKGVPPAQFRTVLWKPANSLACGAGYMARFPAGILGDPLATRIHYGSGSVRASSTNPWGAVIYDELVPLFGVAFWNDAQSLGAAEQPAAPNGAITPAPSNLPAAPGRREPVADDSSSGAWAFAAFSLFAVTIAAAWGAAHYRARATPHAGRGAHVSTARTATS